ncbi:uncharacterized protein LOC135824861 isoform X2 [Sycon ciliatum]
MFLHQFVVDMVLGSIWHWLGPTLFEILCLPFLVIYLAANILWMFLRSTLWVLCLLVEMFRSRLGPRQVFNQRLFELGEFLRSKPLLKWCEVIILAIVRYTPFMLKTALRQSTVHNFMYLRHSLRLFLYQALGSWYPFEPPGEDGTLSENPHDRISDESNYTEMIVGGYVTCLCGLVICCWGGAAIFIGLLVMSSGLATLFRSWRLLNVHVTIPSSSEHEESKARQQVSERKSLDPHGPDLSTDREFPLPEFRWPKRTSPWSTRRSLPVPDSRSWDEPTVNQRSNERRKSLRQKVKKDKEATAKWKMTADHRWISVDK